MPISIPTDQRSEINAMTPIAASRQLVVVIAADWDSSSGQLQRFDRAGTGLSWQAGGEIIPVSLGRHGLAWGIGLHGTADAVGPRKAEGDGRAPAGVFTIDGLFGEAPADSPFARAARLPYQPAHQALKCVDDPASCHYNRIVDAETVDRDWQSCEAMLRKDARYAIGATIGHNPDHLAGAGSCLFIHVWQAAGLPTAGCTAGALNEITALCAWLDGSCAPALVQLPAVAYRCYQPAWGLPASWPMRPNDDSSPAGR